jgi:hypothetical protein
MREKLPARRDTLTLPLRFTSGDGNVIALYVSFGLDDQRRVREAFCKAFKVGSDQQALVHDALIVMSVALQCGQSMSDLARVLGADHLDKPPRSFISLIARVGARLDAEHNPIPVPATEAAAVGGVETDAGTKVALNVTYHTADAEAGEKRSAPEPTPQTSVAGVTAGRAPAPSFRCGDSALEPEGEDWATQMTRLAAEEVAKASPPLPPPDTDHDRGGLVFEIPAFLRRTNRDGASA